MTASDDRKYEGAKLEAHLRALGITPTIDACRAYRAGQGAARWNSAHPVERKHEPLNTTEKDTNQ